MCGDLTKDSLEINFINLDEEVFIKKEIDVSEIFSKEDLIEKINNLSIQKNEYIEIILIGNRNFEINKYDLLKYILNERILKIKDKTKIAYDLEKIKNENTLKGIFSKQMLEKMNNKELSEDEKEILEKAIEIAFEALE